ncbi:MAG: AEC family transporter [Devosiaceae bacterium]|nr:AEC family transporter [Devosiaceae bacterium MH13]
MPADTIAAALIPVMLVIALGFTARWSGLVSDAHVGGAERVTYVVLFPTLLFSNLSVARFEGPDVWALTGLLVAVQILVCVASWVLFVRSSLPGPAATSAFQGVVRFNTYIALALVFALFGERGVQTASVPLAFVIIIVNLFCVAILTRYGERAEGAPAPSMVRAVVTNPLIIACLLGLAINPLQVPWPGPVERVFEWFSAAAIALGLFAVGAGLKPLSGKGSVLAISSANAIGLIAKPALFLIAGLLFALPAEMLTIGLICTCVPTATSAYILARQLGGDAPLMAQIVTVGTLASALTVTAWMSLLPVLAGP